MDFITVNGQAVGRGRASGVARAARITRLLKLFAGASPTLSASKLLRPNLVYNVALRNESCRPQPVGRPRPATGEPSQKIYGHRTPAGHVTHFGWIDNNENYYAITIVRGTVGRRRAPERGQWVEGKVLCQRLAPHTLPASAPAPPRVTPVKATRATSHAIAFPYESFHNTRHLGGSVKVAATCRTDEKTENWLCWLTRSYYLREFFSADSPQVNARSDIALVGVTS
ncbi:hypothetical protein EVAR_5966_1 [Eumeta japonica]|uniref:Uncharacterized protein n=1 Tax=Eumeta variegata TaxID=151549 RepID=A0A4C1TCF1_EUMVA|nr:hypothetical protein EVAR_5966_1 [Eumeta japonica]